MLNTTHHRSAANTTQSTGGGGWAGAGLGIMILTSLGRQGKHTQLPHVAARVHGGSDPSPRAG